jgi:hypothetical protein
MQELGKALVRAAPRGRERRQEASVIKANRHRHEVEAV